MPYFGFRPKPRQRTNYYRSQTDTMVTRKRKYPSKGYKSFKRRVKETEPAKHSYAAGTVKATVMEHNRIYTRNLTSEITQGTSSVGRIGDSIFACALKFRASFQTPQSDGGYTYRVMVFWSSEEYSAAYTNVDNFDGSGFTVSQLFHGNTGVVWAPNGCVNSKHITVLYDETIDINTLTTTNEELKSIAFTVPLNKEINYEESGSVMAKNNNLYMVIVGCVIGGAVNITSVGNANIAYDLIYK